MRETLRELTRLLSLTLSVLPLETYFPIQTHTCTLFAWKSPLHGVCKKFSFLRSNYTDVSYAFFQHKSESRYIFINSRFLRCKMCSCIYNTAVRSKLWNLIIFSASTAFKARHFASFVHLYRKNNTCSDCYLNEKSKIYLHWLLFNGGQGVSTLVVLTYSAHIKMFFFLLSFIYQLGFTKGLRVRTSQTIPLPTPPRLIRFMILKEKKKYVSRYL